MARQLEEYQLIERSIIKTYRKELWNPFVEGVQQYRLISDGDRIAVKLQNTAASMLLAKLLSHLQRISETQFALLVLCDTDDAATIENAARLHIPVRMVSSDGIKEALTQTGCNKQAQDTCMSDVLEAMLGGLLCNAALKAMLPKQTADGAPELILPLYCIGRDSILKWARYNSLCFDEAPAGDTAAMIEDLKRINPAIEHNLFKSIHAVCLDTFPGYTLDREWHSFLDKYDRTETEV